MFVICSNPSCNFSGKAGDYKYCPDCGKADTILYGCPHCTDNLGSPTVFKKENQQYCSKCGKRIKQ